MLVNAQWKIYSWKAKTHKKQDSVGLSKTKQYWGKLRFWNDFV